MVTLETTRSTAAGGLRARARIRMAVVLACSLLITACSSPGPGADDEAESSEDIIAVDHASGTQSAPVNVEVSGEDGVSVTFRELTIAPGASTGEHCHHGQLIAVVEQGSLTHYADIDEGGVHVYEAGDSIIEGAGYRHEGRNEGDVAVVLWVAYVTPEGEPLAETDLTHCDI